MLYSETLPKSPASAARARRALDRLAGEFPRDVLADARLLVSELIANAVEHVQGGESIGLRIETRDGVLRVEVRDPGQGFTFQPRRPGSPLDSGWGLHFLDLLADRWDADVQDESRVWFELGTAAAEVA